MFGKSLEIEVVKDDTLLAFAYKVPPYGRHGIYGVVALIGVALVGATAVENQRCCQSQNAILPAYSLHYTAKVAGEVQFLANFLCKCCVIFIR